MPTIPTKRPDYKDDVRSLLTSSFKNFIENKHLYANLNLKNNFEELTKEAIKSQKVFISFSSPHKSSATDIIVNFYTSNWFFRGTVTEEDEKRVGRGNFVILDVPTVNSYCEACQDNQPFHFHKGKTFSFLEYQEFYLAYECASCHSQTNSFLIRRDGLKLQLMGRSPVEYIMTPKYIPNNIKKYYVGAVIARNSGATLPSIFMLRTVIEQYIQKCVKKIIDDDSERLLIDKMIDKYYEGLDDMITQRAPSLREAYKQLSSAIHLAAEDKELFEEVRLNIEGHFEMKEMVERLLKNT